MFDFVKRWYYNRKRNSILKDIKRAKNIYLSDPYIGMCYSFYKVNQKRYDEYDDIKKRIPMFKPETFDVDPKLLLGFWWPIHDIESRIKAFDKLIEIYSI